MVATAQTAATSKHPTPRLSDDFNPHAALQRPGVIARLHALFPTSHDCHTDVDCSSPQLRPTRPPPRYLKIRMLTWNMHESAPKGDLQDLLGSVHTSGPVPASEPGTLPAFPLQTGHPYHLVVVAGQECPSLSGIPLGLGAGFKLKEKERDPLERRYSERRYSARRAEQEKDEEEEKLRPRSRHRSLRHHSYRRSNDEDVALNPDTASQDRYSGSHQPLGWTSMLEDWYCNGNTQETSPGFHPEGHEGHAYVDDDGSMVSPKSKSTGDLNARLNVFKKGPYELLIKERMMGIYMAVFVHRDIRDLVERTSKSAVTAGLIGGRVGNKGGVGISMKIAGTTLLFMNAHLAAHEGKVHHRIANFVKIKNELTVDDFLAPDDPRTMAEDLTERFDFAFLCGDLNFRLDVTRLHADWLIARKDYAQALAFDQLRKVMETHEAFVGFEEAPIDFPPTFKYDVQKSKRSKRRSMKRISKPIVLESTQHDKLLTEIEEKSQDQGADSSDEEAEADGEAVSLASTAWTGRSRYTDEQEVDHDDYFVAHNTRNAGNTNLVHDAKSRSSAAVHKAKAKWISLISKPQLPIHKWAKHKHHGLHDGPRSPSLSPLPGPPPLPSPSIPSPLPDLPLPECVTITQPPTPGKKGAIALHEPLNDNLLMPSRSAGSSEQGRAISPFTAKTASTRTNQSNEISDEEEEKGVYDSSHKQRVPSWCDRILWKSNLEPDPEVNLEEADTTPVLPPRTRMGSLLHAFRPASLRTRKDSATSAEELPPSPTSVTDGANDSLRSTPRPTYLAPVGLRHSRSTDFAHTRDKPQPYRTRTYLPALDGTQVQPRPSSLISMPNSKTNSPHLAQARPAAQGRSPSVPSKDFLPHPAPVTSLWKSFNFLPFLRDGTPHNAVLERPATPESLPPPPPQKGDVVCLEYNTLDDRQMSRLEGKSDHRPVIGSFALYI